MRIESDREREERKREIEREKRGEKEIEREKRGKERYRGRREEGKR